jgi:hypothetical protein
MKYTTSIWAIIIILGCVFSIAACSKKDDDVTVKWKTLETPIMDVQVPINWSFIDLHGIDTYNGLLTNTSDSMKFDYGLNIDTFAVDTSMFIFRYATVDGKRAKILESIGTPSIYGMAIDSAKVTQVNTSPAQYVVRRFVMMQSSDAQMDRGTAMKILQSVKFKQ